MIALLLSAVSLSQNLEAVELSRNSELNGQVVRYFGVEDTTLDPNQPETSQGGIAFLKGGAGKVVLIRFGDLRRSIGVNKIIRSVTLLLTPTSPSQAKLDKASEVLVEWHEGPAFVVNFGNLNADAGKATEGAATYRWLSGGSSPTLWKGLGASGLGETSTLSKARMTVLDDGRFSISGIESAIQRTYDSPFEVGGVALQFSSSCEFYSSQSPQFSPVLKLELEDTAQVPTFDLSVSCIKRSPWPKLPTTTGDPAWPNSGEVIEHRAEIRNVGSLPCSGFRYRWKNEGSWGGWVQEFSQFAPGAIKLASLSIPFLQPKNQTSLATITFEVEALQPEANRANNTLEVPTAGLGIAIQIPKERKGDVNPRGTTDPMDSAQSLVELFNRVVFPQSRYSFAPGGANERLYICGFDSDASKSADFTMELQPKWNSNINVLAKLVSTFELNIDVPNYAYTLVDPFGGLSGSGETRFDGALPRTFFVPREPIFHSLLNIALAEPTRLLSMTDVYGLNQDIGKRASQRGAYVQNCPILTVFRALDMTGQPLIGAKIAAYKMLPNGVRVIEPFAKSTTDANGGFQLPKQDVEGKPNSNPFGKVTLNRLEGEILFILESGSGATCSIWPWQILDIFARAGASPAVFEVRFNDSGAPIETTNLASNRIISVSDPSSFRSPNLANDANSSTFCQLPGDLGAWVEIDLGRDRAIGEVKLFYDWDNFWGDFEILGYNTGQKPEEAVIWRKVKGSTQTALFFEGDIGSGGQAHVPFRAPAQRFRYLRIRNLKAGKSAKLYEVQVFGVGPGKN